MPVFKEVWQFTGPQGTAWNEVYYSEELTIAGAASWTSEQINARLKLLHFANRLATVRVSQVDVKRKSVPVRFNLPGLDTVTDTPANSAEACVVTLGNGTRGVSRKAWMRGMREAAISRNTSGFDTIDPDFSKNLGYWLDHLAKVENRYLIYAEKRIGEGGVSRLDVERVNGSIQPGFSTVTFTEPHALQKGLYVRFLDFSRKTFPGLNGRYLVLDAPTNESVVVEYRTVLDANIVPVRGYGKWSSYWEDAYLSRDLCRFAYLGKRDTKNADTGSRGARRGQPLRRR